MKKCGPAPQNSPFQSIFFRFSTFYILTAYPQSSQKGISPSLQIPGSGSEPLELGCINLAFILFTSLAFFRVRFPRFMGTVWPQPA